MRCSKGKLLLNGGKTPYRYDNKSNTDLPPVALHLEVLRLANSTSHIYLLYPDYV